MYQMLRHLHLFPPPSACEGLRACVDHALEVQPVTRVPVLDDAGIPYAVDLQLTEGAYLLLAGFVVLSVIRSVVLETVLRARALNSDDGPDA